MNPIINNKIFNVIEQFFYSGLDRIQTSKLIKNTGYDFKTVKKYLKELEKLELITEHKDLSIPTYEANYRNKYFLNIKRQKIIDDIFMSQFPKYLNKRLGDTACILFGSCARGDYYEDSDIDIFIQSTNVKLDPDKYEKKLHRKINPFFEEKWQNLNEGMRNALLNDGISINGRLKT